MSRILYLAWQHALYYRTKTIILVTSLTLTFVLPLTAHLLIRHYGDALRARAHATPLVLGAHGKRFDLVLKALYFSTPTVDPVYLAEVATLRDSGLATPIPLQLEYTAQGHPIVGTSLAYFDYRGLVPVRGHLPRRLGQVVLGAAVAVDERLGPGDYLFSDQRSLYDISRTYPLKMQVVGVLAPTDTPDDRAVFVDVKTSWIIAGLTHGHQDVEREPNAAVVLGRTENEVVTNASILEYNEVTEENIESFHTHAPPSALPLSAIIVVPRDAKAATILKARYNTTPHQRYRLLVPTEVIDDLLGVVFQVQRFFNASFGLVVVSVVLLLSLVVLLSRRLRERELETMVKLGCRRRTTFLLQAAELGLVLILSVALSAAASGIVVWAAPRLVFLI